MNKLKQYWASFILIGTDENIPEDELKRIILSTQVYLAVLIVCIGFTFVFSFTPAIEAAALTASAAITMSFCLFLNYKKKGLLSRKISLYVPTVLNTIGGIYYGELLGVQYGFLILLLIPLLYFNSSKDFIPYYLWCFLNIFITLYFFAFHEPLYGSMNDSFALRLSVYFNNVFLMLMIIYTFYNVTTSYQKKNASLLKQIIEKNNELEEFVYMASHDLKEPIRTISAYSNLLDNKLSDSKDEDLNQFIFFIRNGAKRMNKLLTDLLDYSTVGKHTLELKEIELESTIREVNKNLKLAIQESQTKIIVNPLPIVIGSSSLLVQLFQNVIANSIKYRKKKEASIIEIFAEETSEKVLIKIKDRGIGIKEEDLNQIFKPFYKIHNQSEYEGSGVGLSTCKKICDMLEARIWMTSKFGIGSCTYIEFSQED